MKLTRVKMFSEYSELDLEESINKWLRSNPVEIKDIKFGNWIEWSEYQPQVADGVGVNAMLIYSVDEERAQVEKQN
ncbi:hypothetical protein [Ligilactobacillus murinus]|uniref:hypothetical protein n=1 Tax=Ligilactobacillus murinus TaxID=1622 RepID=UPI002DD6918D|nr:hypothetical protein [Ligilactobacillus murinus]WRY37109.1 hypothetical protein P8F80_08675 [Ligilactobacillus murinus]